MGRFSQGLSEPGCPRTARTLPRPLLPATASHHTWLQSPALHPCSVGEGKLSCCQALRAPPMNKAIQEILPFLYLLKYIQSSSICFSSHGSYGYRVTVVPPSLFVFFLLSDIPVGSPNGSSAWRDACSVSRAGLEGRTPLPRRPHATAAGVGTALLARSGSGLARPHNTGPAGGEGKDHAGKESCRPARAWANTPVRLGPTTGVPRTPARHRPSPDTSLSRLQGGFPCRDVPEEGLGCSFQAQSRFLCYRLSNAWSLPPCEHQSTPLSVRSQLIGGRAPDCYPTDPSPFPEVIRCLTDVVHRDQQPWNPDDVSRAMGGSSTPSCGLNGLLRVAVLGRSTSTGQVVGFFLKTKPH